MCPGPAEGRRSRGSSAVRVSAPLPRKKVVGVHFSEWIWFVVAVVVVGGGSLWIERDKRRRRAKLERQCRQRGWQYRRRSTESPSVLRRVVCFLNNRTLFDVEHVITGEHRGHQFEAVEYTFRRNERRSRNAGSGRIPDRTFERVKLRIPEHEARLEVDHRTPGRAGTVLDKVLDFGAGKPKEIPFGEGEFADKFRVRTDNEPLAKAVLTPQAQAFLLEHSRSTDPVFRTTGDALVVEAEKGLSVKGVTGKLDYLVELAACIPDASWSG